MWTSSCASIKTQSLPIDIYLGTKLELRNMTICLVLDVFFLQAFWGSCQELQILGLGVLTEVLNIAKIQVPNSFPTTEKPQYMQGQT